MIGEKKEDTAERVEIKRLVAFVGMAMGMFLAVLNIQIVGSSFDEIKGGLAAGPEEVSWVLTSALIAEVIMIPMAGWLSRLMSTRWLFTSCTLAFGAASIGCAQSTSIEEMIVFRSLQGLMGGGLAPMIFAAIYASYPKHYQNYLLAIVSLLGTSAMALGPSLGGWISEEASWPRRSLMLVKSMGWLLSFGASRADGALHIQLLAGRHSFVRLFQKSCCKLVHFRVVFSTPSK